MFDLVHFFHLLGAAVWTGGLITLGALVPAMRKAGVERPQLQAVARRFGIVSWTAMSVTLGTGIVQLLELDVDTSLQSAFGQRLFVKLLLVGVAISLAVLHQVTAHRTSAKVRGMVQGLILLISIGIFAAAVAL